MRLRQVCVFCASSPGARPVYAEAAAELGRELAGRGLTLVYGGGDVGLMGTVADAALGAGGEVIGVIPEALVAKEIGHRGLSELRVVGSMHERKAAMADLADGFIMLPGGFGTLEEFCEVLTWTQLGLHAKPCAVLDVAGFFEPLLALFDSAVEERFVRPEHRALVVHGTDVASVLDQLESYEHVRVEKWIDRKGR